MAEDIDLPPLYDPLTMRGDNLSNTWQMYIGILIDTLTEYLSHIGIRTPQLTAAELADVESPYTAIIGSPLGDLEDISGLQAFDTTNRLPKVFIITFAGSNVATATWRTIQLV